MATITERTYTPEDLLFMPGGDHFELVDGKLVGRNMSVISGWIAATLITLLRNHCEARDLGEVFSSDLGYQCFADSPGKVRRPDVSFIRSGRLTADAWRKGYCPIVPDLAIEVLSPNDLASEIEQKVEEYLAAGVPLIWVVSPEARSVRIIRTDGSAAQIRLDDELSGEEVVPGFACPVRKLFPPEPTMPPTEAPAAP